MFEITTLDHAVVASMIRFQTRDRYVRSDAVVEAAWDAGIIDDSSDYDAFMADVEKRLSLYTGNSSPCWRCQKSESEGEIFWQENTGQYLHWDCEPVMLDEVMPPCHVCGAGWVRENHGLVLAHLETCKGAFE